MKLSGLVWVLVCTASPALHAGPAEKAIVAAMKLSDEKNYSWFTVVQDDTRTYEIEGKLVRDNATWIRMPMIDSIADRLGRDADDRLEAFFKGNLTCVIHTDGGWKTLKELPRAPARGVDDFYYTSGPANSGFDEEKEIPGAAAPGFASQFFDSGRKTPYSNEQLAASPPHEELAIIVECGQGLIVDGMTVTGTLSARGAEMLLLPAPASNVSPLATSGKFRLWVRDGRVTEYQLQLEGVLLYGKRKILVHQASQTVVRGIGTTTVAIPDEARLKLANLR
jgi:hypothetical protein